MKKHCLKFSFQVIGLAIGVSAVAIALSGCAGTNTDTARIVFNIASNSAPVSINIGGDTLSNTSTNGLSGANGASVSLIPN